MILVTGAAGKTGRAVLRALARRGVHARALVHRAEQTAAAREAGAGDVVVGDMRDPEVVTQAMVGVHTVYHICPNMHPEEEAIGRVVLNAAQAAGVEYFVYHSVLHPQTEKMPHHWHKLRVEEMIFESGLPFTILQPTAYMQNLLGYWPAIVNEGVYRVPYAPETRISLVDLEDVAQVAAIVLTEARHQGAIYELCGPEALTQHEVAQVLAQVLGRDVRAEALPRDEWERNARQAGLSEYAVDTLKRMFEYYERYGFWGNGNVLRWLLGREPTRLADFVRRVVKGES